MKFENKVVDEKRGIVRITLEDERWYKKQVGIEEMHVPSVTWITSFYPKGIQFWKWLADKGWDESQALKSAAGDKGSKIHKAIEMLLDGEEIAHDAKFMNNSTGLEEELTGDEYEAILSFRDWFEKTKPEIIQAETVTFSDKYQYAGTVDFICKIGEAIWIVDFKTGQNIWPEHELQLSAYKQALVEEGRLNRKGEENAEIKLATLQIGYRKNKNKYKFTEVTDKFNLFLGARLIWKAETEKQVPLQKDFPVSISLNINKEK